MKQREFSERIGIERGAGIIEVLVASAVLAFVVLGATVVFSVQQSTVSKDYGLDQIRDASAIVNADAQAVQAYDPSAHQKLVAAGQQVWGVSIPRPSASPASVSLQAAPSGGGLSVLARGGGQQTSLLISLPSPKPVPQ